MATEMAEMEKLKLVLEEKGITDVVREDFLDGGYCYIATTPAAVRLTLSKRPDGKWNFTARPTEELRLAVGEVLPLYVA